jgi:arylsulfatase A
MKMKNKSMQHHVKKLSCTVSSTKTFIVAVLLLSCFTPMIEAADRPNIIFILVDDQGYYDLGCYGATEVKTPNIDALAKQGIRFTDYYAAAPICSPSRAGILTGCYPKRVGLATWVQRADSKIGVHPNELTLAELLKSAGYSTACIGKWHLGFEPEFLPRAQGFDHYYGLYHNLDPVEVVYFQEQGGVPLIRNGEVVKRPAQPEELAGLYTDEAIQFIENHLDQKKNNPFFIYLPHTMLHNPLGVSDAFKGKSAWGEYGDAIVEMDHHVGRLMESLKKNKIQDNTIVVYVSDNGRGPGRNAEQPLKGRKLSTFEAGIRVPGVIWGPGVKIRNDFTSSHVVSAMDWYPTLASFAGVKIPQGRVIDGRDLSSLFTGATDEIPIHSQKPSLNSGVVFNRTWEPSGEWKEMISRKSYQDAFFYHGSHGSLAAVRWNNWKLYLNPQLTLYDLKTDPSESKPVRNGMIARKLRGMAVIFQEEMTLHARKPGIAKEKSKAPSRTQIPRSVSESLDEHLNLTYAKYGDRTLELDLYKLKNQKHPLPAIVCIHGGGWAKGTRASHANLAKGIAAKGYVAVTISYRLSGEAPFPAQIHDCKAAVRWLRANAAKYGIDSNKIGAIGLSAGGHLTALLATSNGVKELEGNGGNQNFSSVIQAAVPMGAQTDFESMRTKEISQDEKRGTIWRQFLGGAQVDQLETYRLASPLTHLDKTDPPIAFMSGENDDPSTHADKFRVKAKTLSLFTSFRSIKDAPHGFLNRQDWFDQCIEYSSAFFTIQLKSTE